MYHNVLFSSETIWTWSHHGFSIDKIVIYWICQNVIVIDHYIAALRYRYNTDLVSKQGKCDESPKSLDDKKKFFSSFPKNKKIAYVNLYTTKKRSQLLNQTFFFYILLSWLLQFLLYETSNFNILRLELSIKVT